MANTDTTPAMVIAGEPTEDIISAIATAREILNDSSKTWTPFQIHFLETGIRNLENELTSRG